MIQASDRTRSTGALSGVLQQCSELLHPKLRRLLNPNVVDAAVRIQLHFANGALNHLREADTEPSYVRSLQECGEDNQLVGETLKTCLKTLLSRIEARLGAGWHGVVTLNVAISGGQATISSEADWIHKPSAK